MNIFKKQFLLLAFIIGLQSSSCFLGTLLTILNGAELFVNVITKLPPIVSSVVDVISDTKRIFRPPQSGRLVNEAFEVEDLMDPNDAVEQFNPVQGSAVENLEDTIEKYRKELVGKFVDIDTQLDNLGVFTYKSVKQIQQLINDLPDEIGIVLKKQIVGEFIMTINRQWDRVSEFMRRGVSRKEYHHLIMLSLEYIEHNIANFRIAITPSASLTFSDTGLLTSIAKKQRAGGYNRCDGETFHRKVVHIFQMIVACEAKADVLQALAYNEECAGDDAWKGMFKHWQYDYKQQLERYLIELRNVLAMEENPYITSCDDNNQQLFNVISSEPLYYFSKVKIQNCIPIDSTLGCDNLSNCQIVDDQLMSRSSICYKQSNNSLYQIFKYDEQSSKFFQDGDDCSDPISIATKNIKLCSCACERYEKLILALMQSRVNYNYVVVAVRLQKVKNYIYIQIAEGKLGANGYVSNYAWILPTQKKNGEDPFDATLTINEGRAMALDDVLLPHEYTLIGIKFSRQNLYGEKGFKIGLYGVKFDYDTGKLNPMNETFILAKDLPVCEICSRKNEQESNSIQYTLAEFRSSGYKFQNSPRELPAFNPAPIIPNPLTPIRGVGIFYDDFTGPPHLSLRLFTLDYIRYIDIEKLEKMNITLPIIEESKDYV